MSAQDERTAEYEAARDHLQNLIDNPEKHLPVIDYITHLRDARKAVTRAYKALEAAHG